MLVDPKGPFLVTELNSWTSGVAQSRSVQEALDKPVAFHVEEAPVVEFCEHVVIVLMALDPSRSKS